MTLLEQIQHQQLIENTLYEIVNIVNEERGISSEVRNKVNDVKYQLINSIKNCQSLPYNKDFITFKKGNFDTVIFDRPITINWEYYSFINEDLKNKTYIKDCSGQLHQIINGYEINLIIKAVQDKIDFSRTLETLQHEFEHLWERIHLMTSYKGMNVYKVSTQLMNDHYNEYNQSVGRILYLSKKWEQRAYANGVYQYLINHPIPNLTRENIKDTQLYNALIILKEDVKKLKNINNAEQHPLLKSTLLDLKSDFGIQFPQLIEIGEKTINNIIRILGRTLSKVEDDLSKKEKGEVLFPNYNFINKRFN